MTFDGNISSLEARWHVLRLKPAHVAVYAKVSGATLSRVINGQTTFSVGEMQRISDFVTVAEELTKRAGATLDWKNADSIKALIGKYEIERKNPPVEPVGKI